MRLLVRSVVNVACLTAGMLIGLVLGVVELTVR
jgi:hypothetical protein